VLTLVARGARGEVALLDENGEIVRSLPSGTRHHSVQPVVWPAALALVATRADRLALLDAQGAVLHEWALSPIGRNPVVATARFGLAGDPHLAVLTESSSGIGLAVLTIFAADGALVHREVVKKTSGLHTIPRPGGDLLLFGDGRHRVWRLAAAPAAAARDAAVQR
jgi:hypothetical protein